MAAYPNHVFIVAGKDLDPSKDPLRIKGLTNEDGAVQIRSFDI